MISTAYLASPYLENVRIASELRTAVKVITSGKKE
jgi:hypothetical protein